MSNVGSARVVSSVSAALKAVWWIPLLRGLALIALGILVMVRPLNTLIALTLIFGIFLLVDAAITVAHAVANRKQPGWKWWLVQGLVDLVFAGLLLLWPNLTVVVFFYLLVVWTIALGATAIIGSATLAKNKDLAWPWLLVFGLVAVLFGVMLLLRGGDSLSGTINVVGLLLGVFAFIAGSVQIVTAFSVRSMARDIDSALKGESPVLAAIIEREQNSAAQEAARVAEHEAEKAQRAAEKDAERAAREAEKQAERELKQQQRNAERTVEDTDQQDGPAQ
ncbi:DUF308 domain-containing protein [Timonella senegalensis]|uniref:DUF308 domain-containing protein n=1 Tax=Timonella senegalensis TaxID=1465825 RepID=UPI002FDE7F0F